MATLGILNALKILRLAPEGATLDGGPEGKVFLPVAQVPRNSEPGQVLQVFVYRDEDGDLVATSRIPLVQRGVVAHLKIAGVNREGASLVWGLPKHLPLPWTEVKVEQKVQIREGQRVLVIVFLDEAGQLIASTRLEEFLSDEAEEFQEGDKVSLVIADRTDIGVRVVVNNRYWGMVHDNDIFGELPRGECREGYIKALRADHKLNISLSPPGYAKIDAVAQNLLDVLKKRGGFLPVTDKSQPEAIYALFGISKKVFKQTLGALYKARRILIEADGIRMVDEK